ncbi:MAG: hemerythrin domain-containing protein [Planctomycetota bacterium]
MTDERASQGPLYRLMEEHRHIAQVACGLEVLAWRCESRGVLDLEAAREIVAFFQGYLARFHEPKEEHHLYPRAERRGILREGGLIATMYREHEEGHRLVAELARIVEAPRRTPTGSAADFAARARRYLRLLRDHIDKEDHCLYAMVQDVLTPADMSELGPIFDSFETLDLGGGIATAYVDRARRLADRLGVRRERRRAGQGEWASGMY